MPHYLTFCTHGQHWASHLQVGDKAAAPDGGMGDTAEADQENEMETPEEVVKEDETEDSEAELGFTKDAAENKREILHSASPGPSP